jgi:uncharacterized protein (TIGR02145 family)
MKKLITLILGITLVYSCSSSSDSNENTIVLNIPGPDITDIEGNIYQTVTNCNQTWTTSNLNVSKYRNGDIIPLVSDPTVWANLTTGAWCYYNNDPANGVIYGKLYNWYAVNDSRGLAPLGCHIPTDVEWDTLKTCLGRSDSAKKMKETGTTHWLINDPNATNSSGFTGRPGGYMHYLGLFDAIGTEGNWWSSSFNVDTGSRWAFYIRKSTTDNGSELGQHGRSKNNGFSVRCVKD